MTTITMTQHQMKVYVDNVFQKYDKDKSYTLDLQQLSEFLNDLLLSRGSIALPSLEQVKNSMRALNPNNPNGLTKQTLYTALERLNGTVDDIVVAILETMNYQEPQLRSNNANNGTNRLTASYTHSRQPSPRPSPRTLNPVQTMSNANMIPQSQTPTQTQTQTQSNQISNQQIHQIQQTQNNTLNHQRSSANLYGVPQQYRSQNPLGVRSTPTPVVNQNQYQYQQPQNPLTRTVPVPTYTNPPVNQAAYHQQQVYNNPYGAYQNSYGYGQPQGNYGMGGYSTNPYNVYGGGSPGYPPTAMGYPNSNMPPTGAPLPPSDPLLNALINFF